MKISSRQYAQSLYESVAQKSEKEVKVVLKNFVALLGKQRELGRVEEIIFAFNEIWNKANGEVVATLTSARKLDAVAKKMIVDYLENKADAKKIVLTEEIDEKLIGGFILKYDGKVIDGSLKTSLDDLKNKLSS
jgi:F-type H+-transporting ATPase subunit delta